MTCGMSTSCPREFEVRRGPLDVTRADELEMENKVMSRLIYNFRRNLPITGQRTHRHPRWASLIAWCLSPTRIPSGFELLLQVLWCHASFLLRNFSTSDLPNSFFRNNFTSSTENHKIWIFVVVLRLLASVMTTLTDTLFIVRHEIGPLATFYLWTNSSGWDLLRKWVNMPMKYDKSDRKSEMISLIIMLALIYTG